MCSVRLPALRSPLGLASIACIAAWSCGSTGDTDPPDTLDLSAVEIIDLSYGYGEDTLYWPTSPSDFELDRLAYGPADGGYFYAANTFCTPEHGGTHVDAPIHFSANGATLDQIPVDRLVARGVVIDVSTSAAADTDYRLTVADVRAWESEHGQVPTGSIVLLRTGWESRWPDARRYLGDDTPGDASNLHFPGYGEDAARLLVDERGVVALGIDTASIDHGPSNDFLVHRVVAEAGAIGLENVANLSRLPPVGAWIVALPMKIGGGSGGPIRIVALVSSG